MEHDPTIGYYQIERGENLKSIQFVIGVWLVLFMVSGCSKPEAVNENNEVVKGMHVVEVLPGNLFLLKDAEKYLAMVQVSSGPAVWGIEFELKQSKIEQYISGGTQYLKTLDKEVASNIKEYSTRQLKGHIRKQMFDAVDQWKNSSRHK